MEVIVIDHHSIPKALPLKCILINPKLPDQKYPFRELAGVGVVFKFAQALWKKIIPKKEPHLKWLLDHFRWSTTALDTYLKDPAEFLHYTLLRVRLETGRTHQIRAHLAMIDLPVAGDPDYGGRGMLELERQFLHSARLALMHPATGERLEWRSHLPKDLAEALERARSAANH